MKMQNWFGIASVITVTLAAGYFVSAEGQGTAAAPNNQEVSQKPGISIDEALAMARKHVEVNKIDVSRHHINGVVLNLNPRGDRGPFWEIKWVRDVPVKGGYMFAHVYMDKSTAMLYGE